MSRTDRARRVWRRVLLKALALPVRVERLAAPRAASRLAAAHREWRSAPPRRKGEEQDFAVTAPHHGRRPTETRGAAERALRILVIRPDHLGDLLLTTPALSLLRAGLPEAAITALVGPWALPALAGRPEVDAVRTCAFPGFTRAPAGGPLAPYRLLLTEARRLRRARYDAALVLRVDHWWGAALAAYAGIPLRLGYGVPESRDLLTHALPPDLAQHSVRESWRVVAALLGVLGRPLPRAAPAPVLATPSPAGEAAASRWLAARGVAPASRLIAVHPGTGADVKLWPAAHWSAVADALAARLDARVVVTGSATERDLVAAVCAGMQAEAIDAAAALDWDGLAALFARCALVLGVDSGPLHLAAALGVPSVHVFGPTAPARFGPWGRGAHHVVRAALPCSPCGNLLAPPCGARREPACLRAVQPEAVIAAALAAVAAGDTAPAASLPGLGLIQQSPAIAAAAGSAAVIVADTTPQDRPDKAVAGCADCNSPRLDAALPVVLPGGTASAPAYMAAGPAAGSAAAPGASPAGRP